MNGDDSGTECDRTRTEREEWLLKNLDCLPSGDADLPPIRGETEEKDVKRRFKEGHSNGPCQNKSAVRFLSEEEDKKGDGKRSAIELKARYAEIDEGRAYLDAMRVKPSEERTNGGLGDISPLAVGESGSESSSSDENPVVPFLPKSIHNDPPDEKIDARDYFSPRPINGRTVYVDHWGNQKEAHKKGNDSTVGADGEKNIHGDDEEDNTPAVRRRLRERQAMHDKPC